jgi:hypothetical protein
LEAPVLSSSLAREGSHYYDLNGGITLLHSPKDAVLSSQKIKQIIEEELGESEQDEYKGLDWSTRALIAFTRGKMRLISRSALRTKQLEFV